LAYLSAETLRSYLDQETESLLFVRFSHRFREVLDAERATNLLLHAHTYPHRAARKAFKCEHGLLVDEFPGYDDATQCKSQRWLIRGVSTVDGTCKILKMDAKRDYTAYAHLQLTAAQAQELHLVHLERYIEVADQSTFGDGRVSQRETDVVVMPQYCTSLADVRQLPEEVVFRRAQPLARALACLHDRGCSHNDIKPGNIFIAADGEWYLGDWGSMTFPNDPDRWFEVTTTPRYYPRDVGKSFGPDLDRWMLAVSLLTKLEPACPQLRGEGEHGQYRRGDILAAIAALELEEFSAWLLALLN
jgi:hypothetical protein